MLFRLTSVRYCPLSAGRYRAEVCGYCCGELHSGRDTDGELFDLCAECQAELTAFTFEEAS